jgi:tetratricopeptide (TPR) repeat protein
MPAWTPFPHTTSYPFDAAMVKAQWHRLHVGNREPLPEDPRVLAAWVLFHRGEFEAAAEAGEKLGPDGLTVANKARLIHADYLEPREKVRQELFWDIAQRTAAHAAAQPQQANAHYLHGYALGRYTQGVSVAKALAQGLGGKVKASLETAIALQPAHADACIALGTFHAEVIDKVGPLIGSMTYGAKKDTSLSLFAQGLERLPNSAIALTEYARALVMLDGDAKQEEAQRLYEKAAAIAPLDAMGHLGVALVKAELSA